MIPNPDYQPRVTRGGRVFWQTIRRTRECGGKVRHPTEELAAEAAISMEKATGYKFNHYHCHYCHYYHIGRDHKSMGEKGYDGK
jgi:hypothetical protein